MSFSTALFSLALFAVGIVGIIVVGYLIIRRSKSGVQSERHDQWDRVQLQTQKQGSMIPSSSSPRVRDIAYGLFLCYVVMQGILVVGGFGAYILDKVPGMSALVGPLMLLAMAAASLSTFPFLIGMVFALIGFLGSHDRRMLLLLCLSLIMLVSNVLLLIWAIWAGSGSASLWERDAGFRILGITSMVLSVASLLLLDSLSAILSVWWFRIGRKRTISAAAH